MHGSLAKLMATTELNVNRLTATLFSSFEGKITTSYIKISYRAHSKWGNGSTHTLYTSLKDKLSKTATRHLASIKTICYSIPT